MRKKFNFPAFLQGLAAAAIGGAILGTAGAMTDPTLDFAQLGKIAAAGAAVSASAFFLKSPLAPRKPKDPIK